MVFPDVVTQRTITAGSAYTLVKGRPLKLVVTVKPSRSLVRQTGDVRLRAVEEEFSGGEAGEEIAFTLPVTDQAGWIDETTRAVIDVSAPNSHTHLYDATITLKDENGRTVGTAVKIPAFPVPTGDGSPIDLDLLIPGETVDGVQVSIPDVWSGLVEAAQQAASDAADAAASRIPVTEKGAPQGVAELDADARVPQAQLPEHLTPAELSATFVQPRGLRAVFFGDSQTDQGGRVNANDRGYWVWMNAILGQPFATAINSGVSGETLAQMLARVQASVIDHAPDWVFILGGKNSISGGQTLAQMQTTYIAILDAIRAGGNPNVVVVTDPPHNSRPAGERAIRDQFNDWLRRLPQTRPQVRAAIDAYASVVDHTSGDFATGMAFDALHPSAAGAHRIGRVAADVMRPLLPRVDLLPTGPDSLNLLGAAGGFPGARTAAGATIGLAPDWSEYHAGDNSTFSKVARTDGIQGEWQQVVTAAAQHTQQLYKDVTTGFAVGDTVYAMHEMQIDTLGEAPNGVFPQWFMQVAFVDAGGANLPSPPYPVQALAPGGSSADARRSSPSGTIILRTPNFVVPAGTARLRIQLMDYAASTTFRHGRTVIRKVPTA